MTVSEDFFQGHFPGQPVMPGVLMLESLAQAAAILLLDRDGEPHKTRASLRGVDGVKFRRQIVPDPTGEVPGTIVVDLKNHFLYLVQPGGDALRYGVGIGKAGFEWSGRANIQYKKQWPTWKPPAEMIARKPELVKWANGQPGGIDNPLGARALYIFKDGQDTGYRIHGSPEWWTIGQNMSWRRVFGKW